MGTSKDTSEESRDRLSRLENLDEETAELEERLAEGERRLGVLATSLRSGREAAAGRLSGKVQENLEDLNLGKTTFRAELVPTEPGPSGTERVEFVIQPNPGEPELPVRRYASGGELSRIMLAIRLAQERLEPGATYIFDEVDAGIGGETATAVGAKLRELGEQQPGPYHHPPPSDSLRGGHARRRRERRDGGADDHAHRAHRGRGAPQGARQDALGKDRRSLPRPRLRTPGRRHIGGPPASPPPDGGTLRRW